MAVSAAPVAAVHGHHLPWWVMPVRKIDVRARGDDPLQVARARGTPHFYVVGEDLRVIFHTAAADPSDELALPPGVEPVVRGLKADLDESREVSAIGVIAENEVVRLLRLDGDGEPHYAVFLERFAVRNSVENAAARFGLSARETDVLKGLMRGESTNEVARRLGIGATTVQEHIRKIGRKTHVTRRSEIVATVFGLR